MTFNDHYRKGLESHQGQRSALKTAAAMNVLGFAAMAAAVTLTVLGMGAYAVACVAFAFAVGGQAGVARLGAYVGQLSSRVEQLPEEDG